jgi:hypothetical protein
MGDEILVEIYGDEADDAERDRLARALRRELLGIREIDKVAGAQAGPAPPGSRSAGLAAVGALVVSVQPTLELLGKVLRVAKGWLDRKPSGAAAPKSMRVTFNGQILDFYPNEQQQAEVVAAFLAAATAGGRSSTPDVSPDAPGDT